MFGSVKNNDQFSQNQVNSKTLSKTGKLNFLKGARYFGLCFLVTGGFWLHEVGAVQPIITAGHHYFLWLKHRVQPYVVIKRGRKAGVYARARALSQLYLCIGHVRSVHFCNLGKST